MGAKVHALGWALSSGNSTMKDDSVHVYNPPGLPGLDFEFAGGSIAGASLVGTGRPTSHRRPTQRSEGLEPLARKGGSDNSAASGCQASSDLAASPLLP